MFGRVPLLSVGADGVVEPLPVEPLVTELPLDPLLPEPLPLPLEPDDPDDEDAAFATTTTVPFMNGCSEQM